MGLLNPGKHSYLEAMNSLVFVDKSAMIGVTNRLVNTKSKYLCVSRPRRFGKTIALDMLAAYYGWGAESREMFAGLKLANAPDWDRYLGKFNVLRLTVNRFFRSGRSMSEMLAVMQERILEELHDTFPEVRYDDNDFVYSMDRFSRGTGRPFVILIDEWDAVFREYKHDTEGQKLYLDFLRDWLKDQEFVALAYMTGILPVKKYGKHSALNMFDEYAMTAPLELAEFTGFTEAEVQSLCAQFGRDFGQVKEWYDGYLVRGVAPGPGEPAPAYSLYSPLSVVQTMRTGIIQNWWNKTETYEALAEYIRMDFDGLRETVAELMGGMHMPVNLGTYQNDMTTLTCRDDVLALLIHLGYLGYDSARGEVFIPNREILDEYRNSTRTRGWASTMRALENSQRLLEATWAGNEKVVAELVEAAHDKAGNRTYNSEAALSYAVQLAYYKAQDDYTVIPELDTGKGYADLVYLPRRPGIPAMLVELKYDASAEGAIGQILRKDYPSRLEHYRGNLILVGINYERSAAPHAPDFKHHSCRLLRA